MKRIPADLHALVAKTYGYAELEWTRSIPIPDDPDFPVLQPPADKLRYSTERGYPIQLAPRRLAGHGAVLYVQIESFDLARHTAESPGWAIPTKYTPETDEERIAHELGFDEGWEDAERECTFICDARFSVFWRAARARQRFGLTAFGTSSLYVVDLGASELAPLERILAKWPR